MDSGCLLVPANQKETTRESKPDSTPDSTSPSTPHLCPSSRSWFIHKPPNDLGTGVDLSLLHRIFLMLKRDAQEKRSHHPLYDLAHQQMICSSPPSMAELSEASTPGRLCWYRWPSILPSNGCMLVALCSMIGIFPGIGWSLKEWCHYCRTCVGLTRPM